VLVLSALHFLTELDDPQGSVSIVKARMAPGSFLAISHAISDGTATDTTAMIEGTYARATAPVLFRTEAEVRAFFAGLELTPPGLADVSEWRRASGAGRRQSGPPSMCIFGGVGKKPTGRSEGRG
jgi:hypothetical protein